MLPGLPDNLPTILTSSHSMRVKVAVLDLEGRPVSNVTATVLDGSVNVDTTAEVTRSASLVLLDPDHHLGFDSNSPAPGALYADRMVRIVYGVRLPGARWVDVDVFTGPITKFSRDGVRVTVEAQGKEVLAQGVAWRVRTFKKGTPKIDVIRSVLAETGERTFAFDHATAKLPTDRSLVHDSVPWAFAREVAGSMGKQLFYDGAGRCVLREPPGRSVFTFTTGTGGSIRTAPQVEFLVDNVRNAVRVTGRAPKGKKKPGAPTPKKKAPEPKIVGNAVAPAGHPLSPARLGRNGEPRYLAEFVDAPSAGTNAEAKKVAEERLAQLLAEVVNVTFEALPIPHLDGGDWITVRTDDFAVQQRLSTFSIPLTVAGTMSVGFNRRQKKPARARGRR